MKVYKKRDVPPIFSEARIILLHHSTSSHSPLPPQQTHSSNNTETSGFTHHSSTIGKTPTTLLLHSVSNTFSHISPHPQPYPFDDPSLIHVIPIHLTMCHYITYLFFCGCLGHASVKLCSQIRDPKDPACPVIKKGERCNVIIKDARNSICPVCHAKNEEISQAQINP